MFRKLITLSAILISVYSYGTPETAKLNCKINVEKNVFYVGEPILVNASVTNESSVQFGTSLYNIRRSFKIKKSTNETIKFIGMIFEFTEIPTIEPGETIQAVFNLEEDYKLFSKEKKKIISLDEGDYSISLVLGDLLNSTKTRKHNFSSNQIDIKIIPKGESFQMEYDLYDSILSKIKNFNIDRRNYHLFKSIKDDITIFESTYPTSSFINELYTNYFMVGITTKIIGKTFVDNHMHSYYQKYPNNLNVFNLIMQEYKYIKQIKGSEEADNQMQMLIQGNYDDIVKNYALKAKSATRSRRER